MFLMLLPAELARTLMIIGAIIFILGLFLAFQDSLPFLKLFGRLPGDIEIKREGFQLYFPIATSIVISLILSLVLWLVRKM